MCRHIAFGVFFMFGAAACDSGTLWQDAPYDLAWIDTHDNNIIYYRLDNGDGIGRVDANVVAVGRDEHFLVAKRQDEDNQIWFYYIEISKDRNYFNASDITQGPFDEQAFMALTETLGLPPFEHTFRSRPTDLLETK